ncbi:hypothetical protein ElyMa_001160900 [Elysia marginata]|uniref:Uncharacterized protein n=1 Tax=Elysia marginata TaxID=1093978 RepID=A0AAV4I4F2_9GAST|nr:hypothetical protein ElyMa_001160900 [Elysia marginata]
MNNQINSNNSNNNIINNNNSNYSGKPLVFQALTILLSKQRLLNVTSIHHSVTVKTRRHLIKNSPPAQNTDPALFLNLFQSSPQAGGGGGAPSPTDLSSLVGPGASSFAGGAGVGSPAPNSMFPTLGGSSMGSMPPAATQRKPRDFNGHSLLWGYQDTNKTGKYLEEVCTTTNLSIQQNESSP